MGELKRGRSPLSLKGGGWEKIKRGGVELFGYSQLFIDSGGVVG